MAHQTISRIHRHPGERHTLRITVAEDDPDVTAAAVTEVRWVLYAVETDAAEVTKTLTGGGVTVADSSDDSALVVDVPLDEADTTGLPALAHRWDLTLTVDAGDPFLAGEGVIDMRRNSPHGPS